MSQNNIVDVVVVGAGPAGSTTAYYLVKGGLRVALLDKAHFPRDKTCGDGLTPRAVKVLHELSVLDQVVEQAYRCNAITLRLSDKVTFNLDLSDLSGLPDYLLVLPRFSLDNLLLQHAIDAGVQFIGDAKVEMIEEDDGGGVHVSIQGKDQITGALVVVATGASSSLLKNIGLLRHNPPTNLAARGYFENVDLLDDSIVLFFDGVDLPGYGWVFPITHTSANIGCGLFFDGKTPRTTQLSSLVQAHPYLKKILKNARQVGPLKGFPIRTDFAPAHGGSGSVIVVGEAVGLVNPITGEGIDYALESAGLAAEAILEGWQKGDTPSPAIAANYRRALRKKFSYQLALNHLAQKIYFRPGALDNLLCRAQDSQYLRRAIVDACFGSADPVVMITPRTLWEVFKP